MKWLLLECRWEALQKIGVDCSKYGTLGFAYCCEGLVRFVRYVSNNAYTMSALHGTDFMSSARDSFNLIMRNFLKVTVTTQVR